MWYYRTKLYTAIADNKDEKYKNLDPDAAEKAFVSLINCFKTDKNKDYYDEERGMLAPAAFKIYTKSQDYIKAKEYEKASHYTSLLFDGLPFDKDSTMKRSGFSQNSLNYQMFSISYSMNNFSASKEYLQKLIDAKYDNVNIYRFMADIYANENNPEKQLSYIELGRNAFPKDENLIADELNYYLKQNKSELLLEKVSKAIELTPNNEILYFTQARIYQGKYEKEQDNIKKEEALAKAEAAYKKAIEIKPDYGDAIYNIGKLYLDKGIEFNNAANNLPPKESKKIQEQTDKAKAEFAKSIPYLEKAHLQNPADMQISKTLKQLYVTTGDNDKYNKLNEEMKSKK